MKHTGRTFKEIREKTANEQQNTMKTYYVLWTYSANFSRLIEVQAESAEQAKEKTTGYFHKEFQEKGNVFVFDTPPALIVKGKYYDE